MVGMLLSDLGIQLEVFVLGLRDGGRVSRVLRGHVAEDGVEALLVCYVVHGADLVTRVYVGVGTWNG